MPQPLRILHVFSALYRGGAEMLVRELLRHVGRGRYEFHFCLLSGREGPVAEEFRELGARLHPLSVLAPGFSGRFRKLLAAERIDVVHSHVHRSSGWVLRQAARAGVPVRIAHFHSSHDGRPAGLRRSVQRAVMQHWIRRYATRVIGASRWVLDAVWGPSWPADPRFAVIYNGVSREPFGGPADREGVRREFGLAAGSPCYVHVGRFHPAKNHERLVAVFAEVVRLQPTAGLLLVGGGDPELAEAIRRRVAGLGLGGRVVFCGERTDVPRLVAAADAMVFPSRREGLPLAVVEARAAGTPVVASDLPGIVEIAERLPGVVCLPLAEDDRTWAGRIVEAGASRRAGGPPAGLPAGSVFTIQRFAEAVCGVWEPARAEAAA
jgi:glycosyltransferase involved in cell wall biosynthesis